MVPLLRFWVGNFVQTEIFLGVNSGRSSGTKFETSRNSGTRIEIAVLACALLSSSFSETSSEYPSVHGRMHTHHT